MDNILPAFNKNNIPIVLAMDDKYSKYTSVMLISLRNNANMTRNYDILIFHKDISFENQNKLKSIFKNCDNFSLRFIDLSEHLEGLKLPVFSYYSIEIYFRLFIPYILNEYTRVIYLDCDMIVKGDISELWKQSLDGNTIGAVRDYGMILHYYTKGKVYIPKEYFEKTLVGVNPDNYFNSGVLLIDTKKYKETYTLQYILDYAQKEKWHFPDQDLLNILFSGSTKIIPSKFNTVPNTSGDRNVDYLKRNIPIQYFNEYYEARNNPTIIHFAQREKPWKYTINLDYELFSYFWKYAAQTEYFMTLLYEIKRYTSLLEALHIAQTFLNNKIERKVSSENIVYICGKYCIGSYSEIVTRFEYCKLSEREIIVEGYTEVPFCEDPKSVNLFFMVNGTSYACSIFERYPIFFQKQYKNCIYGFPIGFRCRIPIDSCTERYEIFLTTVLDQIKMKNVHINYGMFFPVDRINKYQYYFSNNWILKAKGCLLRLERAGKRKRIKNEVKYLSSLLKNRTKYDYKSVICRIALFISNFMVHDKKIWIISDNFLADDNGIAFFRFLCQKKGKKCCPYFVVDKKQMQYYTIKKMGRVVDRNSRVYKWLLLRSCVTISSVVDIGLRFPFGQGNSNYRDILAKKRFVFLQHGIITDDLSLEHNKYCYQPSGFIVSAKKEYESILEEKYHYYDNEVWLTGMPRIDFLYNNSKKNITIMPTWRYYLKDNHVKYGVVEDFKESDFYIFYNSLLNSEKLHKAANCFGYKICFKPHPLLLDAVELFDLRKVTLLSDNYKTIYAESSLIITDYSSACIDFAYLYKPLVYTHFDREIFFAKHVYRPGYFDYERDGFGEVEYDLDSTVDRIIEYMENGCQLKEKYRKRIDSFFAFHDQNNCQRVYDKIIETEKNPS